MIDTLILIGGFILAMYCGVKIWCSKSQRDSFLTEEERNALNGYKGLDKDL